MIHPSLFIERLTSKPMNNKVIGPRIFEVIVVLPQPESFSVDRMNEWNINEAVSNPKQGYWFSFEVYAL